MTRATKCRHCAEKDAEIVRLRDKVLEQAKAAADHQQRMAQQRTRDGS